MDSRTSGAGDRRASYRVEENPNKEATVTTEKMSAEGGISVMGAETINGNGAAYGENLGAFKAQMTVPSTGVSLELNGKNSVPVNEDMRTGEDIA